MILLGEMWLNLGILLGCDLECLVHGFTLVIVPTIASGGVNKWGAGGLGGVGEDVTSCSMEGVGDKGCPVIERGYGVDVSEERAWVG